MNRYLQINPLWFSRLMEKKPLVYLLDQIFLKMQWNSVDVTVNVREAALAAYTNIRSIRYALMSYEGFGVLKVDRANSKNPVYQCKINPEIMFYGSEEEHKKALEEWKGEAI